MEIFELMRLLDTIFHSNRFQTQAAKNYFKAEYFPKNSKKVRLVTCAFTLVESFLAMAFSSR